MPRSSRIAALAALAMTALAGNLPAQDKPQYAGPTEQGFLLPNGWTVSPAGDQVITTDMVLDIKLTPDGKYALVASSGYNAHDLIVVDLASKQVVDKETVRQSWFGLTLDPEAGKVWWSGGGGDRIHGFDLKGHELTRTTPSDLPVPIRRNEAPKDANQGKIDVNVKPEAPLPQPDPNRFKTGLAFDAASKILYSLDIDAGTLTAIDTTGQKPDRTSKVGERPYDVAIARNGKMLYVTDWIGRAVLAVSPEDLRVIASIGVGEHPNQIAVHPEDGRIFVACASSNCVSVIDTDRGIVTETIVTSLFPKAPEGSRRPPPSPSAPTARPSTSPTPTTTAWPLIDIEEREREPGQGLHPHRLVSDRPGRHPGQQDPAGRDRQGEPDQAQPDRRGGQEGSASSPTTARPRRLAPCRSPTSAPRSRAPLDRPGPRREGPRRLYRRPSTRTAPTPTSN